MAKFSTGRLIEWRDGKGFGFVRPDAGGRDFFVHISAFGKGLKRRPAVGDIIHFSAADNDRESAAKRRIERAHIEGVDYKPRKPGAAMGHTPVEQFFNRILITLPLALSLYLIWTRANPIPLVSYIFMSALTVLCYAADKKQAMIGTWRIPEPYLHLLELMGGWPGGLLAQNQFRHKAKKPSYQWIFWSIVVLHAVLWFVALYPENPPIYFK
ncbi:DUF1294 domain-containing protein [Candidatus Methylospira mobilis]|uniref:DUF1294 domain-containing protein n=1 Tax=Candidatus Methylospira mobilis TaxID=1808979 RepID=A0A5Q0BCM1_9GAMM|nr:cold shock and DUF1294 domain-containing protein [Candidatus Methylospira mobilis]QFY41550.1 DUF1294 domain-containing protein [Candidatus Methylospira mobilis]WNV05210.1 cold shock and DUF1294 domain-containing protein [Candidatus Methylospira mobilis]